jgi:hypothetical protein
MIFWVTYNGLFKYGVGLVFHTKFKTHFGFFWLFRNIGYEFHGFAFLGVYWKSFLD